MTETLVIDGGPGPQPAWVEPALVAPEQEFSRLLALAGEHEAAGRLDEAEAILTRLMVEYPDRPRALHLYGIVLFRKSRGDEAVRYVERAIALLPDMALFHRNLCEMYRKQRRFDAALLEGLRAVELDPNDIHAHHNLGVLHYHRLELDDAIKRAEAALALAADMPGAHFGIAEACLLKGDLARGWEEYEWRFKLGSAPPLMPPTDQPQWNGAPLPRNATLLLIADQGYGDVIQFSRYIPWAIERCPSVAIACSRELHSAIGQFAGIGKVFDRWEHKPDFSAWLPLSGLPRLAGTRLDTIPAPIPYLRADPVQAQAWRERLAVLAPPGYRRIGIVWAGRPTHSNDDNRSTGLATFAPLAELPGVALVSLQKGGAQAQIGGYWGRAPLLNLGPEIRDYGDTMAIVDALDLILTVDTSVGHLAGAMGKPVWIMLPYAPDWRWLLERGDSPWYPTARLFRQDATRDWRPVIATIAAEIAGRHADRQPD
ncbi:MAG TPA: tetratricopeptide repeat-containing glycosyltransferase family protein [Stellaceae bacterium]|nr:tetratricopeptide repeat-containing glycosyltransferase family protein [Stellaceae bacterium]